MRSQMEARVSCVLIAAVFLCWLTPCTTSRAADAPVKPPELKTLDRLVGEWTTATAITVLDAQPVDMKSTGTISRKWALDGRIIEETGLSSAGEQTRVIFTYDA